MKWNNMRQELDRSYDEHMARLKEMEQFICPPGVIPRPMQNPRGSPHFWHRAASHSWGRRSKHLLSLAMTDQAPPPRALWIHMTLGWLAQRTTASGGSMLSTRGHAVQQADPSSLRLELPMAPNLEDLGEGWVKGWHGTTLYALHSILTNGGLRASSSGTEGARFFDTLPAIYFHDAPLRHKALWYATWSPLFRGGFAVRCWLETAADSARMHSRHGQRIVPEEGAHILAVWFQTLALHDIPPGGRIYEAHLRGMDPGT
jgi:hypothetical protein